MSEQIASTPFRRTCTSCGTTVATTDPGESGSEFFCSTSCFVVALGLRAHCGLPVDELAPLTDDDGRPVHLLCSDVPF